MCLLIFEQNVPECPADLGSYKMDELARGLASLHQICSTHIDDIHILSMSNVSEFPWKSAYICNSYFTICSTVKKSL